MPPRPTNITPEHGRDAARFELPVAWAKDAMDAASTRSVLGLLKRYWRAFQKQRRRERLGAKLSYLSDGQLMDIGLTREEIDYITPQRAIDRLRDSAYLWSRGAI
jgi:uncharacterized protein YjiS (DUF1127 family)